MKNENNDLIATSEFPKFPNDGTLAEIIPKGYCVFLKNSWELLDSDFAAKAVSTNLLRRNPNFVENDMIVLADGRIYYIIKGKGVEVVSHHTKKWRSRSNEIAKAILSFPTSPFVCI